VADELRRAGDVAGAGTLQVDRVMARDKLCRFRLANPYLYVLQFVRAASIAGASTIEFTIDADEMECVFDVAIPRQVVGELWTRAYGDRTEPLDHVAYQLALGLGSARAMRPREIRLETSAHGGATLRLTPDVEERIAGEYHGEGTRIYVREKFRVEHFFEFFAARAGVLEEIQVLEDYCAVSWLDIRVNGRKVSYGSGPKSDDRHLVRNEHGRSELGLTPGNMLEIRVLKHDVMVARWAGPGHGVGAAGRVDSPHFRTDLSSLELIQDAEFQEVASQVIYGGYHGAIRQSLRDLPASASAMELAANVLERMIQRQSDGQPVPDQTAALFREFLAHPMWPRADAVNTFVSFHALTGHGRHRFPYVRKRMGHTRLEGHEMVAYLPDESGDVRIDPSPSSQAMYRAMRAMCQLTGNSFVDLSEELRRLNQRATNEELWRSRPPAPPPEADYQVDVSTGGLRAWAYLPVPRARYGTPFLAMKIDGRTVEERDASTPFAVELDGEFQPNPTFSGIEIAGDDDALELLSRLAHRLPDVITALAEEATRDLTPEKRRILRWWIRACFDGSAQREFFAQFGLSGEQISALITEDPRPRPPCFRLDRFLHGGPPPSPHDVLPVLGSVTDVPLFSIWPDRSASLRELADRGQLLYVDDAEAGQLLRDDQADGTIVVVGPDGKQILQLLFGAEPALPVIRRRRLRQVHLEKPPYEPDSETALHTVVDRDDDRAIEVRLLHGGDRRCDVDFVYLDRLLGRAHFETSTGQFEATIWSERLEPDETWSDVARNETARRFLSELTPLCGRALMEWFDSYVEVGEVPDDQTLRTMYFELCVDRFVRAGRDHARDALPIVELVDGEPHRRLTSYANLTEETRRAGGCLPIVRTPEVDSTALGQVDCPALDVGRANVDVVESLFDECRILDVSRQASDRRVRDFYEQPRFDDDLSAAPVVIDVDRDGLTGRVAWHPCTRDAHLERPRAQVHVLLHGRLLETLMLPVPFGRFRMVFEGRKITPDPEYSFVAGGRAEVLRAAMAGACEAIRTGVRRLSRGDGNRLRGLRADVWRLIAALRHTDFRPPFDSLRDLLEEPVLETTSGRWLTFDELREISSGGRCLHASRGGSDRILFIPADQLHLAREALRGWTLVDAEAADVPLYDAHEANDRRAESAPLLRQISHLLLAARGERPHLFDDHMARRIRWAADSASLTGVCRVRTAGVEVNRKHPLVTAVSDDLRDRGAIAFLASVVYSEVNRHYREITDHDELVLQRSFLSLMRA
jgi:hypothetical protein